MDPFEQLLVSSTPQSAVAPEVLEMLGRQAALKFIQGGTPLNQAIVELASQHPELENEHIRRVVEFANNNAFQQIFERSEDKNVHFAVADPGVVIRDLKDGGSPAHDGKTVDSNKDMGPPAMEKQDFADPESGMEQLTRNNESEGLHGRGEQIQKQAAKATGAGSAIARMLDDPEKLRAVRAVFNPAPVKKTGVLERIRSMFKGAAGPPPIPAAAKRAVGALAGKAAPIAKATAGAPALKVMQGGAAAPGRAAAGAVRPSAVPPPAPGMPGRAQFEAQRAAATAPQPAARPAGTPPPVPASYQITHGAVSPAAPSAGASPLSGRAQRVQASGLTATSGSPATNAALADLRGMRTGGVAGALAHNPELAANYSQLKTAMKKYAAWIKQGLVKTAACQRLEQEIGELMVICGIDSFEKLARMEADDDAGFESDYGSHTHGAREALYRQSLPTAKKKEWDDTESRGTKRVGRGALLGMLGVGALGAGAGALLGGRGGRLSGAGAGAGIGALTGLLGGTAAGGIYHSRKEQENPHYQKSREIGQENYDRPTVEHVEQMHGALYNHMAQDALGPLHSNGRLLADFEHPSGKIVPKGTRLQVGQYDHARKGVPVRVGPHEMLLGHDETPQHPHTLHVLPHPDEMNDVLTQIIAAHAPQQHEESRQPPRTKTADWHVRDMDHELEALFTKGAETVQDTPQDEHVNPVENIYDLHNNLQRSRTELLTAHEDFHTMRKEAKEELYQAVKREVLDADGVGLSGVAAAFEKLAGSAAAVMPHLEPIINRLVDAGVYPDVLDAQMYKEASAVALNPEHPLVRAWAGMAKTAVEMDRLTLALRELDAGLEQTDGFLRQVS